MTLMYSAYHLTIASEIELPELFNLADQSQSIDVQIRYENVPDHGLDDGQKMGPFLWVAKDKLWLKIPGVARFLVINGQEILIDPAPDIDEDSIRVFLLGSIFGALLFQRELLVLHGNAIRIGDHCLICVGPSGAGKSTLAAGFMRRGYQVLADDVVPITSSGDALPGFPRIKLWQDVADQFNIKTSELRRIRPDMEKFNLPVNDLGLQQKLPVRWVYILNNENINEITVEPMTGMEKFQALKTNTYRPKFLAAMDLKPQHFQLCGQLAGQIHLARLTRPNQGFKLDKLIDTILLDIEARA
ncbi:hypothetical protein [Celerinatantimonas yamalensis]|uniref:Hpr(Ser) kinase/phosphatase n=1 Tax=Celerinatantimonas yamalensis TaxID=559956 RepID=A0ABW9G630_9GAMM